MVKKGSLKWEFRDVSSGLQRLREFLLGRKYVYHNRFPPLISPRSIPPPDIPRGPEYKYSDQWYGKRSVLDSVKPPVVAPIAEGRTKPKGFQCPKKDDSGIFNCPPTPGLPWWFDGHCYYELVASKCPPQPPNPCVCEPPPPSKKCPPPCPEKKPSPPPCTPPPKPCDPCKPPPPSSCP